MLIVLLQLVLLLAVSGGAAWGLAQLLAPGRSWTPARAVLYTAAGFAVQILLLQNLVYLQFPVRQTYFLPLAAGLYGLYRLWPSLGRPRGEWRRVAVAGLIVFFAQSISLLWEGPGHYYGKAHIDQVNYTLHAEFLLEESYRTTFDDIGLKPWMIKGLQDRDKRIGQSVAHAYLAAISFRPVHEAYGTLTLFFVALMAALSYALARRFGLNRWLALLAAVWTGLSPAITHTHLDGFLSQTSVLFVFPALALWGRMRDQTLRERIALPAIFLAYTFCCYSEFYLLAVGMFAMVVIATLPSPLMPLLARGAASLGLSLVLVPMYLPHGIVYITSQYGGAQSRPELLERLAPHAGTLYGWTRALLALPFGGDRPQYAALMVAGFALVALTAAAFTSRSVRRRFELLCLLTVPWVFLGTLLLSTPLPKYPFGKISDHFAFLWILLIVLGLARLAQGLRARRTGIAAAAVLLAGGVTGMALEHLEIHRHQGTVGVLQAEPLREAFAYLEDNPQRTVVIRDSDPLATAWLAYHARRSRTYIDSPQISDLPLQPNTFPFTRVPEISPELSYVSRRGVQAPGLTAQPPDIDIRNPQGESATADRSSVWYWLGDSMEIDIVRWDGAPNVVQYDAVFLAEVGPAHPSGERKLSLRKDGTPLSSEMEFRAAKEIRVPILLTAGRNRFTLTNLAPREHLVKIPGDPAKHMTRISRFRLENRTAVKSDDARLAQLERAARIPAPSIAIANPQGRDGTGDAAWWWIGPPAEIIVTRRDNEAGAQPVEIALRAQAGPAHTDRQRTLRLVNPATGEKDEAAFSNTAIARFRLTLPPGETKLRFEVAAPTQGLRILPGDPRSLVVRIENPAAQLLFR